MRSSSQSEIAHREVIQAQPALGHELVAPVTSATAVEQQRAGPARAHQLARGELEQVAVDAWDRGVAELAVLLGLAPHRASVRALSQPRQSRAREAAGWRRHRLQALLSRRHRSTPGPEHLELQET